MKRKLDTIDDKRAWLHVLVPLMQQCPELLGLDALRALRCTCKRLKVVANSIPQCMARLQVDEKNEPVAWEVRRKTGRSVVVSESSVVFCDYRPVCERKEIGNVHIVQHLLRSERVPMYSSRAWKLFDLGAGPNYIRGADNKYTMKPELCEIAVPRERGELARIHCCRHERSENLSKEETDQVLRLVRKYHPAEGTATDKILEYELMRIRQAQVAVS